MAVGATSSYGAATPIPNPVDGTRILGLLSRIGPAALACSYSGIALVVLSWFFLGTTRRAGSTAAAVPHPTLAHPGDVGGAVDPHPAGVLP